MQESLLTSCKVPLYVSPLYVQGDLLSNAELQWFIGFSVTFNPTLIFKKKLKKLFSSHVHDICKGHVYLR